MFRFTIRELILLTIIVAVCAAWWLDRQRQFRVAAELRLELDAARHDIKTLIWRATEYSPFD